MNPFSRFSIYPVLGTGSAHIEWTLKDDVVGGVHIFRSTTAAPGDWERLTENPLPPEGTWWDRAAPRTDNLNQIYYRGLVVEDPDPETWLRGDSVSALAGLTRREHGLLKAIMRREWKDMRRGNGLEAWHCIPLNRGEVADGVDPLTQLPLAAGCTESERFGFGQTYAGGFGPPLLTRARFMRIEGMADTPRDGEQGYDSDKNVMLRLMAFPRPRSGHMIVLRDSDRRYVLDDPIQPLWFKADHAVAWECPARLLDRRDYRHRLTMPDLPVDDLDWIAQALMQPLSIGNAILTGTDDQQPLAGPA